MVVRFIVSGPFGWDGEHESSPVLNDAVASSAEIVLGCPGYVEFPVQITP